MYVYIYIYYTYVIPIYYIDIPMRFAASCQLGDGCRSLQPAGVCRLMIIIITITIIYELYWGSYFVRVMKLYSEFLLAKRYDFGVAFLLGQGGGGTTKVTPKVVWFGVSVLAVATNNVETATCYMTRHMRNCHFVLFFLFSFVLFSCYYLFMFLFSSFYKENPNWVSSTGGL